MRRLVFLFPLILGLACAAEDEDLVFRSDVSLVRVDAQVVDRNNRAITGLTQEDFVLTENGQAQEIRNFGREDMPVDVLLLLDVSGSMRSHIERLASASRRALDVLGPQDRVAVMVFDRSTRVRMRFRNSHDEVERELHNVINQETFDGGTDITRALYDAAQWIGREARRDARRAIVILTDDQTERGRDEAGIGRALSNSGTVLSAIIAPNSMGSGRVRGGWPQGGGYPGGGYPGTRYPGGGMGGPLGGIILGRRGPYGGNGPVVTVPHTQSAGTSDIARRSGGDSMRVDNASALETTLTRIRQRYALHFNLPEGVKPGQERDIDVQLSAVARKRYPDAQVKSWRMSGGGYSDSAPVISDSRRRRPAPATTEVPTAGEPTSSDANGGWRRAEASSAPAAKRAEASDPEPQPRRSRRRTTDGSTPDRQGPLTPAGDENTGLWRRTDGTTPNPVVRPPVEKEEAPAAQQSGGGWRRVKPGEQP